MSHEYKIFVGGLTVQTTEQELEDYFSSLGSVTQVAIIKNKQTGLSKCYAFVHTNDARTYQRIINRKHSLNGRVIDCKDGFNKDENPVLFEKLNNKKIFVGGLSASTQDRHLSEYFSRFGKVFKAYVIIDPKTRRSKRFGFIIMEDEESVDAVLSATSHVVNGATINCKRFDRTNPQEKQSKEATKLVQPVSGDIAITPDMLGCFEEILERPHIIQPTTGCYSLQAPLGQFDINSLEEQPCMLNECSANEHFSQVVDIDITGDDYLPYYYEPQAVKEQEFSNCVKDIEASNLKTQTTMHADDNFRYNLCMNESVYDKINQQAGRFLVSLLDYRPVDEEQAGFN